MSTDRKKPVVAGSSTVPILSGKAVAGLLTLLALAFSACGNPPAAASWPQWRGPESQGVSSESNLPSEWSTTKNIVWKTPIPGRGHSSPIVWGNKLFITTAIQGELIPGVKTLQHFTADGDVFLHPDVVGGEYEHTFKVLCLDTETGKILWEGTAYKGRVYDGRHRKNTYASPTPVTDGEYVYAYFGAEGVYCFDFEGNPVWNTSLGRIAVMGMGVATSPVLWEDLVIVQCDQDNGIDSFLAAISKKTGEEVWRVKRAALEGWSSPIVVATKDRTELVVNSRELVIAHDPATGQELWRSDGVGVNPVPTPVTGHNLVVVSAGAGQKRAMAIRLGGSGDVTGTSQIAWEYNKGTAHIPSPILYGNYLYLLTDNGVVTCLDAKTGEVQYRDRVPGPAKFSASPVAFDGKILLTSEERESFVFKAGPTFELLSTNSIGEQVHASPAIAGGKIFIRGEKNLFAIGSLDAE